MSKYKAPKEKSDHKTRGNGFEDLDLAEFVSRLYAKKAWNGSYTDIGLAAHEAAKQVEVTKASSYRLLLTDALAPHLPSCLIDIIGDLGQPGFVLSGS